MRAGYQPQRETARTSTASARGNGTPCGGRYLTQTTAAAVKIQDAFRH
jgi:hypothetical protein